MQDSNYDILFEAVAIGPVVARNRFYQVPHCNGLGHLYPHAEARQRGIKAQGGWAVVSTQEVEIHPGSEWTPFVEGRLWDKQDAKRLALTVAAIHQHNSLAAIEITHNGHNSQNLYSRLPAMGVSGFGFDGYEPAQAAAMTKHDIANVRRWHKQAAIRARDIGFDIIYVYAAHDLGLPFHFLSKRSNKRSDEYGGSLENRVRFMRELLTDTKEVVGDKCAVALRFSVDELRGADGIRADYEAREVVEMLKDLPDLWDVNVSGWANDSASARFSQEGFQQPYTAFVKKITEKPVVGVGRFTSPDLMVAQIKKGVLDFIGAARPSIADPFLPNKIAQGRSEDIRECIGCNICVSCDMTIRPMRCTQNPTVGEEYRRGWHPNEVTVAKSNAAILVVGGGPAGLEAAVTLGQRGYRVVLAEADAQLGGRVWYESRLPGLSSWRRVVDYRVAQLKKMQSVKTYTDSELSATQVVEFAAELNATQVLVASGAIWDLSGVGRMHFKPIDIDGINLYTPDDILQARIQFKNGDEILIYDDDHYYMGGAIAEQLAGAGARVVLVTPAAEVSTWTRNTLEQKQIENRLRELKIRVIEKHKIKNARGGEIILQNINDQSIQTLRAQSVIMITARRPREELYLELQQILENRTDKIKISRVGDCLAPATIAAAVYAGHRFAREFDEELDIDKAAFIREYTQI